MNTILLLLVCTAAWAAWLAAVALGKKAWGHSGGVSIFPVIPFFPVLAWLLAMGIDYLWPPAGSYIVGGIHIGLTIVFLGSSVMSLLRIRRKKK